MSRPADPHAKIALLAAAEAVFAERGLSAAKVEEISRRAGLSKGAFYLHFDSKEGAFKQVVESFLARFGALVFPSPNDADARFELPDSPESIVAFWLERDSQLFEFIWQNRATVAILGGCQGPYAYLLESFRQNVLTSSGRWVEALKEKRLVRPELDAQIVNIILWGAYNELCHSMMSLHKKPPISSWLRQTLSVFLRGLGTPELIVALQQVEATDDPPVSQNVVRPKVVRGARSRARVRN